MLCVSCIIIRLAPRVSTNLHVLSVASGDDGWRTGKMWAHEYWELEKHELPPPDVMTFAKKLQTAGYFAMADMRPKEGYRIFNTWMGDPSKAMMLEAILEEYDENHLIENAKITGNFLMDGIKKLARKAEFRHLIGRVRGRGTFVAFTVNNTELRDELVYMLRQAGVQSGGCGAYSIRLRPAMIFMPEHAAQFLTILEEQLQLLAERVASGDGGLGPVSLDYSDVLPRLKLCTDLWRQSCVCVRVVMTKPDLDFNARVCHDRQLPLCFSF